MIRRAVMSSLKTIHGNAVLKADRVPVDILKGAKAKEDRAAMADAMKNNKGASQFKGSAATVVAMTINSKVTRKQARHAGTRKAAVRRIAKVAMVRGGRQLSVDTRKAMVIREVGTLRVRRAAINQIKRAKLSRNRPISRSPTTTTVTSMAVVVALSPMTLPNRHSVAVRPRRMVDRRHVGEPTTTRTLHRQRVAIPRSGVLRKDDPPTTRNIRSLKRADIRLSVVLLVGLVPMGKRGIEN